MVQNPFNGIERSNVASFHRVLPMNPFNGIERRGSRREGDFTYG